MVHKSLTFSTMIVRTICLPMSKHEAVTTPEPWKKWSLDIPRKGNGAGNVA